MKKKLLLVVIFSIFNSPLIAQQNDSNFWQNVKYGGGIGLSLGDRFFSGTLAPNAIYEFNNQVALGFGLNGTYNAQKDYYKSRILGGSAIVLYNPYNTLQISAEFEQLHVKRTYHKTINLPEETYWSPALFLGIGYRNGNATFGIRYDLLYDETKSIYANAWAPFFRFYF